MNLAILKILYFRVLCTQTGLSDHSQTGIFRNLHQLISKDKVNSAATSYVWICSSQSKVVLGVVLSRKGCMTENTVLLVRLIVLGTPNLHPIVSLTRHTNHSGAAICKRHIYEKKKSRC